MADRCITPEFRATWISVFRAISNKNADGTESKRKFSVRAAFPPTTDMSMLQTLAGQAAEEKWQGKVPKALNSPFRRNSDLDNPVPGIGDDWWIMTFSANEDKFSSRTNLVAADGQPILEETDVYSGAWFWAEVRPYAYEISGNRGVSFGLQNIQKLRDDEPLGGGRAPASKVFSAIGGGAPGKSAASIFG